jgi:hypothetical protein
VQRPSPRSDDREDNREPDSHDIELESSGEVNIIPEEVPPEPSEPRRIHRRRPVPIVPEGPE